MRIIYNQATAKDGGDKVLESIGVKRCYLKHVRISGKSNEFTKKTHHHKGFEVHAVIGGEQKYELCGRVVTVSAGEILIIPPFLRHRVLSVSEVFEKASICFDKDGCEGIPYVYAKTPEPLALAFLTAKDECFSPAPYSQTCITSAAAFIAATVLRLAGVKSDDAPRPRNENTTFALARQYIEDNICADLSTSDVAGYCYLSTKQLTRIFEKESGLPLGAYIRRERCEKIRSLLEEGGLSLARISETMNFKNEYYFNAFFKKNAGMSPGAYAKTINK